MLDEKIISLRKQLNMTQRQLAAKIGVSHVTISQWESGATSPKGRNLVKLAEILGVSASDLTCGSVDPTRGIKSAEYPVLGVVSAGAFREARQEHYSETLESTKNHSDESFWLIVDGHSMTAPQGTGITFPEGMYILVDPNREPTNGSFVVAYCSEKNEATFKKLSIEPEGNFLVPLNPDRAYSRVNMSEAFCEIAGVVVDAKWKML